MKNLVAFLVFPIALFAQTPVTQVEVPRSDASLLPMFMAMHQGYVNWFVRRPGFGNGRMSGVNLPSSQLRLATGLYTVRSVQLISLLEHDPPMVYDASKAPALSFTSGEAYIPKLTMLPVLPPAKATLGKTMPVRPLTEFEKNSLKTIRESDKEANVVVDLTKDEAITGVGAIRAQASCIRCHGDAKAGDLLGAFSYLLTKQLPKQ